MRVRIAFDLASQGQGDFFTLDDPVKGVLDNTTYKLVDDVLIDVTDDVRSVQVKRGRSRTLEKFTAGAANLVLDNRDRTYDPANAATVGTRTNVVPNPSFEVDASEWYPGQFTSLVRDTTDSVYGSACGLGTSDGNANPGIILTAVPVSPGQSWTGSMYVKDVSTGLLTTIANIHWYNESTGISAIAGDAVTLTTDWSRISVTGVAPAGATRAFFIAFITGTPAAGSQIKFDAALLETGSTLGAYFDGSVADGSIRVRSQEWNGTPDASTSTITYNVPGTGSPYSGSLVPRKQVVIDVDGQRLFTGTTEDINLAYSLSGDSTTEFSCTDGFAAITGLNVTPGTATPQGSGARIGAILDVIDWPQGMRDISTGVTTLGADVIGDNQDALAYLQKVELGEAGALFIDSGGALAFRSRTDLEAFTSGPVFGTGGIPFNGIATDYGTEQMRNTVTVTYTGGTATATDATAVAAYGVMEQAYDTLLVDGTQAQAFADYQVDTYAQPRLRITGIDLVLDGLPAEQRAAVLALELGDVTRINWTPNDIGSPISQYATVDGIAHNATPQSHMVSLTLSQTFLGFVLDSTTLGILDTSTLGF